MQQKWYLQFDNNNIDILYIQIIILCTQFSTINNITYKCSKVLYISFRNWDSNYVVSTAYQG